MDDIIVASKTWNDHKRDLTAVLNRLRKQKRFAKMSRCAFGLPEIDYVGFRVGREGIKTQPEKLKALKEWPTPHNVIDVRKFTGCTNFYQKFVHSYATILSPISDLLRQNTPWR